MLDHSVHIHLDEYRYRKIAREAEHRGMSIDALIRDAIDKLPVNEDARRAAVAEILAADPMPVPTDPVELRREIDDNRDREA